MYGGGARARLTIKFPWVLNLSMDSFYRALSPEEQARAFEEEHDFDCPAAFDWDLFRNTLMSLSQG